MGAVGSGVSTNADGVSGVRARFDGRTHPGALVADHHHGLAAAARFGVRQGVRDERRAANVHQRLRHAGLSAAESGTEPGGENHRLMSVGAHQMDCMSSGACVFFIMATRTAVYRRAVAVTVVQTAASGITFNIPCAIRLSIPVLSPIRRVSADRFERDTIDILKRLSRKPIEPALTSALLADLGFDSLQVLELVGELEDHFNIAVPLNALTHIRTVGEIVAEVRRLVHAPGVPVMNRESTLTNALVASASTGRGLRAIEHDGQTSLLPYDVLLTQALIGAGALTAAGLEPGDRVALVVPQVGFIQALFAILAAGLIPVPLVPPVQAGDVRMFQYMYVGAGAERAEKRANMSQRSTRMSGKRRSAIETAPWARRGGVAVAGG